MNKIIGYKIIRGQEYQLNDLGAKINDLIKEGWQPYGELRIYDETCFYQVVVQYEEGEEDQ